MLLKCYHILGLVNYGLPRSRFSTNSVFPLKMYENSCTFEYQRSEGPSGDAARALGIISQFNEVSHYRMVYIFIYLYNTFTLIF